MTGAGSVTCTATLSGPAPSGGTVVNLSTISSGHKLTVPALVTIPDSAAKASFVATVASFQTAQPATITATAGGVSYSYTLQLSPATANLSINATNVSFGDVAVGSQATQTVTLTSSGQAAATVSSASATGTGFSISGATLPVTLNPGQTFALNVQFAPTATGAASGQLAIKSNSSSNPAASVALSGTGGTHEVDLTWNSPASSATVAGYNIYRAPTGTGSYQRVNTSVDPGTAYSDTSVTSGAKYDYVVKSVSSSGTESAPSNVGTVTIP
jgi:predicted phage tail protein